MRDGFDDARSRGEKRASFRDEIIDDRDTTREKLRLTANRLVVAKCIGPFASGLEGGLRNCGSAFEKGTGYGPEATIHELITDEP